MGEGSKIGIRDSGFGIREEEAETACFGLLECPMPNPVCRSRMPPRSRRPASSRLELGPDVRGLMVVETSGNLWSTDS